ncbi:Eco57I restriction-modification methylase domain-containing protein [Microcoleus sp. LAD1_D3]|uniref:Eco57I restriction-modification methylase domain-containing protein n=1 Tax=Microcoleus sp. LAD1_D3 TaxID=2819365 RepID=UPI002FCEE70A
MALFEQMIVPHFQTLALPGNSYSTASNLLDRVDGWRQEATRKLQQSQRGEKGQFLTPSSVANLMAGMFEFNCPDISLLDAGAGIGSLLAAVVCELCQRRNRPSSLHVTAYEIDIILIEYLKQTLELCSIECQHFGISFTCEVREIDFIQDSADMLQPNLFTQPVKREFTHAIINPPYAKIDAKSQARTLLRSIGLETSNLYAGFTVAAAHLLKPNGELVSITPRSFCNGLYFRDFRKVFLQMMALRQVHIFESRQLPFRDDAVLQETIIVRATKQIEQPDTVLITSSSSGGDDLVLSHQLPYTALMNPQDSEQFIRILPDSVSQKVVEQIAQFTCTLEELGLTVSTGKVVDFRVRSDWRLKPENGTVPLIYPAHFSAGGVEYPTATRKHQALAVTEKTAALLVPNEHYVLSKRFSSKEEKKRIVAVVWDANKINSSRVGFENHLNYFHQHGRGLDLTLARGLAVYLNSSLVDAFFRLFNGHTQVNATDLRNLKYPTVEQLLLLGAQIREIFPTQRELDQLVETQLFNDPNPLENSPMTIKNRIDESLEILAALGFPKGQLNERSALTLLALLDLKPKDAWGLAKSPLRGITPIMEFMEQEYGKKYAPNTLETVRHQTVHQFLDAGLIVVNPDSPKRPLKSPKTAYQIEESALELLRTYGTYDWDKNVRAYLVHFNGEKFLQGYSKNRNICESE